MNARNIKKKIQKMVAKILKLIYSLHLTFLIDLFISVLRVYLYVLIT